MDINKTIVNARPRKLSASWTLTDYVLNAPRIGKLKILIMVSGSLFHWTEQFRTSLVETMNRFLFELDDDSTHFRILNALKYLVIEHYCDVENGRNIKDFSIRRRRNFEIEPYSPSDRDDYYWEVRDKYKIMPTIIITYD